VVIPREEVHSHFLPDFYREAATAAGHAQPDGIAGLDYGTAPAAMAAFGDKPPPEIPLESGHDD
jgi:hypothetical protein